MQKPVWEGSASAVRVCAEAAVAGVKLQCCKQSSPPRWRGRKRSRCMATLSRSLCVKAFLPKVISVQIFNKNLFKPGARVSHSRPHFCRSTINKHKVDQAARSSNGTVSRGSDRVNVLPMPTSLCTLIVPPSSRASSCATDSPSPVPAALRVEDRSA